MITTVLHTLVAGLEELLPRTPGDVAAVQRRLRTQGLEVALDVQALEQAAAVVTALSDPDQELDPVAVVGAVAQLVALLDDPDLLPGGIDADLLLRSLLATGWRRMDARSYAAARALGVIATTTVTWSDGTDHQIRVLDPAAGAAAVADPAEAVRTGLAWGSGAFGGRLVRELLARAVLARGGVAAPYSAPAALFGLDGDDPDHPEVDGLLLPLLAGTHQGATFELTLHVVSLPATGAHPPGLLLRLVTRGALPGVPLGGVELALAPTGAEAVLDLELRPGLLELHWPDPDAVLPGGSLGVALTSLDPGPRTLLGQDGGSRLEVTGGSAGLELATGQDGPGLTAFARFDTATLHLSPGGQDSFVSSLLGDGAHIDLPAGLLWQYGQGVHLEGGTGLEVALSPHLKLGPVTVDTVQLGVAPPDGAAGGQVRLRAAADLVVTIGPVTMIVQRLGVQVGLGAGTDGAPVAVDARVLPPTGVGFRLDAPAVTGGGFLSIDPEAGRYAGALQLNLGGIGIGAVGLLTTDDDGWSLLAIIRADLPPVPLGFGFTLTGLGGLVGIHRRAEVDVLRDRVRAGTLGDLLFPDDPVGQATTLLAGLEAAFPGRRSQHVLGPAVQLAWGQPTPLVHMDLALALELPEPLRLLLAGRLTARVPRPELPVVALNLDVLGVLDLTARTVSMDATLFDSRLGPYTLEGEMALRAAWGAQAALTLSVGGLHPQVDPPAGFPELRRVSVALGAGTNPLLRLSGYVALTSNTVQFGARAELRASAAGFSVEASLGFDALVQLSPFRFVVAARAQAQLKRGSRRLFLVDLHLEHLAGPTPWEARGYAKFRIAFVSFEVGFDATFGAGADDDSGAPQVWADLRAALAAPTAWSGQLTGDQQAVVEVADTAADEPLLHPLAPAVLRQGVVPLAEVVERHDGRPVTDPRAYRVTEVRLRGPEGSVVVAHAPVTDRFAPGTFLELTDQERLAAPAYEAYQAGFALTDDTVVQGQVEQVTAGYDVVLLDGTQQEDDGEVAGDDDLLAAELHAATLRRLPPGPAHRRFGTDGPRVGVVDLPYAAVDPDTLLPAADQADTTSWARTRQHVREGGDDRVLLAAHLAADTA
jgi:hypothetical protein